MTDALTRFRAQKDRFFRSDPNSPVDAATFSGLRYYPPSAAHVLRATLEPLEREVVMLTTSTGDAQPYFRVGRAAFELSAQPLALTLYRPTYETAAETEVERFFIPFKDATSGTETCGAGRYLEAARLPDGHVLLDFNYAYSPFCAYSGRYRCPLPPAENRLSVPIHAGEKL
jgi:uncharacterized protein (DUF1684 family)